MTLDNLPIHCRALLHAKQASSKTFSEIAESLGKPEVWTTALFFGQAKCDQATATKIVDTLGMTGGEVVYLSSEDLAQKSIKTEYVVNGLTGSGPGSFGADGMVTRGGTWEWPPKVRRGYLFVSKGGC